MSGRYADVLRSEGRPMTENTASTLDGWPLPDGLRPVPYRPPVASRRRRWPFVVAAVVAAVALAVYLLWPYIVGAVLIAFAWKVISR